MRISGATREAMVLTRMLERRGVSVARDGDAERGRAIFAWIDARHPYAEPLPPATTPPRLRLVRAPWAPTPADRWFEAPDAAALVARLKPYRRVFVTLGRSWVPAFSEDLERTYFFRWRSGETPASVGSVRFVRGVGPFEEEAEQALFAELGVEALVARNDGAKGAAPKMRAARALKLPVYLLARPPVSDPMTHSARAAARWVGLRRPAARI